MGSWYVLSALGLFVTTPGTPDYVMNTPLFKHTIIHRADRGSSSNDDNNDFHIIAQGANMASINTEKVLLNGNEIATPTISDYDIKGGSVLQFVLTNTKSSPVSIEEARVVTQGDSDNGGHYEAKVHQQDTIIQDLRYQLEDIRNHPPAPPNVQHQGPAHNNLEPQYVKLRRGKTVVVLL